MTIDIERHQDTDHEHAQDQDHLCTRLDDHARRLYHRQLIAMTIIEVNQEIHIQLEIIRLVGLVSPNVTKDRP